MNVRCPSCQTIFRVDPAKVPEAGVRARCTICEGVFGVYPEASEVPQVPTPAPRAPTPAPEPAAAVSVTPAAPPPALAPAPVAPPVARPSVSPALPVGRGAGIGRHTGGARPFTSPAAGQRAAPTGAPFNPFLSHDPKQKARRLARALVSDLVVYYPEKRERGLEEGTLKELFDEEIKKSWEEYEEQVGKELAESTTFFNDALNEILGDGSKVF